MINIKNIKIWWQAIRFHFTFPTFLPVLLGTSYALLETGQFDGLSLFAVLLATICHHIGLNLADDYYDYCHGADIFKQIGKNPYAGGSGVLVSKMLTPSIVHLAAMGCYSITIIIGLLLTYIHGYWILALGIFGIFSSFYYTAPPLRLAYLGLGELAIWVNFGPVLVLGSYYVQTHTISVGAVLLSILMGTLIFCVIIANEIPDQETDEASNKRTLIVKYGKNFGLISLIVGIILIFTTILITTILQILPMILIISLIALPISYRGIITLAKTMHTNKIHGNEFIIGFSNILGVLLIAAIDIMLFRAKHYIQACSIIGTLIILYSLTILATPKNN